MLIEKGTKKRERKKRTEKASVMSRSISSSMPHIVYQQPSYLLHMKPKSFIWDHFVVVETKPNGAAKTVHCKHDGCQYRKAANTNRMHQHWQAHHSVPQESLDGLEEDAEELVVDSVDPP